MRQVGNFKNFIYYFRYILFYNLIAFCYLPITFIKRVVFGKDNYWKQYFFSKWGYFPKNLKHELINKKVILIDALSLGEVEQIKKLTSLLKKNNKSYKIVLFTNNKDAFYLAKKNIYIDYVIDSCWDISFIARKLLHEIKPHLILVIENAHFPNLLKEAKKLNIINVLCSGFYPDGWDQNESMKRTFYLEFYKYIDYILVKNKTDLSNFSKLKFNFVKEVLGDLKFDVYTEILNQGQIEEFREGLGFKGNDFVIVVGSIHKYEVDFFMNALKEIKVNKPNVKLLLAPRWLTDVKYIQDKCASNNFNYRLRSVNSNNDFDIFILDTYGELKKVYSLSEIVFIGGSLKKNLRVKELKRWQGLCHNVIEPLVYSKPIFFGRNIQFRKNILNDFLKIDQCFMVDTPNDFSEALKKVFSDHSLPLKVKEVSVNFIEANKDVSKKYFQRINSILLSIP